MRGQPPSYLRIPHLAPSQSATADDRMVFGSARDAILAREAVVEEKLDGSNVMLWLGDGGEVECAGRSGPGAMDRGGQLGRLRAWVSEHRLRLRTVLAEADVVYGEWLWLTHTVFYDRLPSYLVVLDLGAAERRLHPLTVRNRLCQKAGLATPGCLFTGVPGSVEALNGLCGRSRFGHEAMEGVVIRDATEGPVAKLLAPGFRRKTDDEWQKSRSHNQLAPVASVESS